MKQLSDLGKVKITLDDIAAFYNINDYLKLAELIRNMVNANEIEPIKASKTNGKKPALYLSYRIIKRPEFKEEWRTELDFKLHPKLSADYYRRNPDMYEQDRHDILMLNEYLINTDYENAPECSVNERSFMIFHKEKFLDSGGKQLLRNLAFPIERLNVYETREPIAYYSGSKLTPQNLLIVENMDTFYSIRKHLINGSSNLLGIPVGTVIYGRGKGIVKAFEDLDICAEPYMQDSRNTYLYFGDLDFEGIRIYESFFKRFSKSYCIRPFCEGYIKMLEKARKLLLPDTKEGQVDFEMNEFLKVFNHNEQEEIRNILYTRKYIPQEILSINDL